MGRQCADEVQAQPGRIADTLINNKVSSVRRDYTSFGASKFSGSSL